MRFFYLFFAIVLFGCKPNTETIGQDYVNRLANVFDLSTPSVELADIQQFPAPRNMVIPIESVRLDVLDAWSLKECGLLPLIAERNSVLGQVMPASIALDYEVRLLATLNNCVDKDGINTDLMTSLIVQKSAQLSARVWNATIASEEFRQYWGISQPMVAVDEGIQTSALEPILANWTSIASAPLNQDVGLSQFEANNQMLYQLNQGMAWYKSMQAANRTLEHGNHLLSQAIEKPLCPRGAIPAARNAQNVMVKYFVGGLQPHYAQLNRHAELLIPSVEAVNKRLAVGNSKFDQFWQLVTLTHRDFHSLNQQHVALWQALMNSCGLFVPTAS